MNAQLLTTFLCLAAGQSADPTPLPIPVDAPASFSKMPVYLSNPIPSVDRSNGCGELFWLRTDYLQWWTRSGPLPVALATQGSPLDAVPGALGQPGTTVLYGNQHIAFPSTSGYRITAGFWLIPEAGLFVEGSYFQLQTQSSHFSAGSDANGNPVIAQPITNAASGTPNAEDVSYPNPFGFAGKIRVDSTSRLQGYDVTLGLDGGTSNGRHIEWLAGFRALDLREGLSVQTRFYDASGVPGGAGLTFLGVPDTAGSTFSTLDSFQTSNKFYGAQMGTRFTQQWGMFSLKLVAKLDLGATHESANINGYSTLLAPGMAPVNAPGGLLALSSNIGHYSRNVFSAIPEGTLALGVQLTSRLRATAGYDILYWNNVARPGNQIDTTVNRALVPTDQNYAPGTGPNRPAFQGFNGSGYWAQGISFGLEFRY